MRSRPQRSPSPCLLTPISASPPELSFATFGRGNLRGGICYMVSAASSRENPDTTETSTTIAACGFDLKDRSS
jgi:hypothetical protein